MTMPAGPMGVTELDLIIVSSFIVLQLVGGRIISPPGGAPWPATCSMRVARTTPIMVRVLLAA